MSYFIAAMQWLSPARLVTSLSDRGRIAALSLIPLIGLLATGIAFMSGEDQIATAFDNMNQAAALSDATRDFRRAVESMQARARDFVSHPDPVFARDFADAHAVALAQIDIIARLNGAGGPADLSRTRATTAGLSSFFTALVKEQDHLGFDETQGVRGWLREITDAAQQVIKGQLNTFREIDATRLLASLQLMQRHELEFIAWHDELDARIKFFAELGSFNAILDAADVAPDVKGQIRQYMKSYADAFRDVMSVTGRITSFLTAIDRSTRQLLPVVDEIVTQARGNLGGAMTALKTSRARITAIIIAVACLSIIIGVGLSSLIGLGINVQNARFDAALNHMSHGLCMIDADFRVVVCNRRYLEIYGFSPDLVKPGATMLEVMQHSDALGNHGATTGEQRHADFKAQLTTHGSAHFRRELADGRVISISQRPMANGGWVGTHDDVTEQTRAEERIAHLAHHDPLTELPNRAAFNDRFAVVLDRAAQTGEAFAVMCLDLDRFKEVNDVFGHSVGDALLFELSRRLTAASEGAFIARFGGDEFAILAADGPQPLTAELLGERVLGIAGDIEIDGHRLRIGLSVGVAMYPTDGTSATTLLSNADAALYRAKGEGRGTIRFFAAEMDERLRERRGLQRDLHSAIDGGELCLYYQPQALTSGVIIGFEALVRWRHPRRGLIAPTSFIPLAEESGLIIPMGEWILRQACQEAASWPRPLHIAVNLSPVQFQHGDLPATVHAILLETGLAANRLELEITEGVLIGDFSRAVSILRRLKSLGVKIAMDDFGTGYSSLSYLQSFPFDKLKIDRAFLTNLERNPQSPAIIRAVIGLGRALDLRVVAEGVETKDQLAFLSGEACDQIQGYLIGRPLPIDHYADAVGRGPTSGRTTALAS